MPNNSEINPIAAMSGVTIRRADGQNVSSLRGYGGSPHCSGTKSSILFKVWSALSSPE